MTKDEIKTEIRNIISVIAPDEDISVLTDAGAIREELELDSMDFLDIIMELRKRHGIEVPEEDYKHFLSLNSSALYLEPRMSNTH